MTSPNYLADSDWGKLADQDEDSRRQAMVERFRELLALSPEERHQRLKAIAGSEYAQPDDALRTLTLSRLRTLLLLEPDEAQRLAQSYDEVMREMPASAAMRRVSMVQTLVREFTAEEEERLRDLLPTVFAGAPRRKTGLDVADSALITQRPDRKRPWWAFWSR